MKLGNVRLLGAATAFLIGSFAGCHSAPKSDSQTGNRYEPASLAVGQPAAGATSPLKDLLPQFRMAYETERNRVDRELPPLVIVRFSDVFLVKDSQIVATGKGIPSAYHLLHRTAHVPFTIFLKLNAHFGNSLTPELKADLDRFREMVEAAIDDLGNHAFSPEEIEAQKTVLEASVKYLGDLEPGAVLNSKEFHRYRAQIAGPMMYLADSAGAAQVNATHSLMSAWRATLSDDEWSRLLVVIVGFRQPRHDYAATQYFNALFPASANSIFPGETQRVFYVESLDINRDDREFKAARKAVAALILDTQASEAFFNNPYRMSIDVMADGARRRIAELDLTELRSP